MQIPYPRRICDIYITLHKDWFTDYRSLRFLCDSFGCRTFCLSRLILMDKNPILDIIICILKNRKSYLVNKKTSFKIECTYNGKIYGLWNSSYLLGQIIRQYQISDDNYYISSKANALWERITKQNIWNYSYRDKIFCESDEEINVKSYKGASSEYSIITLNSGVPFIFNDIFHDEHIIPINIIIKELESLPEYTYKTVEEILGQIKVCRMLKEEDREIKERCRRPLDFNYIVENIYKKYGIEIRPRVFVKE